VPDKARQPSGRAALSTGGQKHLKIADAGLPGSEAGDEHGPGLSEVCRVCAIRRETTLEGRRIYLNPVSCGCRPSTFTSRAGRGRAQELCRRSGFDVTKKTG